MEIANIINFLLDYFKFINITINSTNYIIMKTNTYFHQDKGNRDRYDHIKSTGMHRFLLETEIFRRHFS